MNHEKEGFTLMELLVVILIIGILAAVVMPQYKKSVQKSYLSNLLSMGSSALKAGEAYYLANATFPTSWDTLDLDFPGEKSGRSISSALGWELFLSTELTGSGNANAIIATDTRIPGIQLLFFYNNSQSATLTNNWNGHIRCYARIDNLEANTLCKSVGSYFGTNPGTDNIYQIK